MKSLWTKNDKLKLKEKHVVEECQLLKVSCIGLENKTFQGHVEAM